MDCIRCDATDAFNRVVVERATGELLGALCESCETAEFGVTLRDTRWHHREGCAICGGDGSVALPFVEFLLEREDPTAEDVVEYDLTDGTVRFCDRHLRELSSARDHRSRAAGLTSP